MTGGSKAAWTNHLPISSPVSPPLNTVGTVTLHAMTNNPPPPPHTHTHTAPTSLSPSVSFATTVKLCVTSSPQSVSSVTFPPPVSHKSEDCVRTAPLPVAVCFLYRSLAS